MIHGTVPEMFDPPGAGETIVMGIPLRVAFRNLRDSAEIETKVRAEAERLGEFRERITSCRVEIEVPHRPHRQGHVYRIQVDMTISGREIVVRHDMVEQGGPRNLDQALRETFDKARCALKALDRPPQGPDEARRPLSLGRVVRLRPERGDGLLATRDGREISFHAHSVSIGGLPELEVGSEVRFVEEMGEEGPRARTVYPLPCRGCRQTDSVVVESAEPDPSRSDLP